MPQSNQARAPQLLSLGSRARELQLLSHVPQLLKPVHPRAGAPQQKNKRSFSLLIIPDRSASLSVGGSSLQDKWNLHSRPVLRAMGRRGDQDGVFVLNKLSF